MAQRDFPQEVEITHDERGFSDDSQAEAAGFGEDFEQRARDPLLALERLIRVGGRAKGDVGSRFQAPQFLGQEPCRVLFEVNLVLEVFRCKFEKFVGIAGIAIAAGKLAAAIGIDGVGEGQLAL